MKLHFFIGVLLIGIGVYSCKDDPATPATTGAISGIVRNDTGAVIAGALITTNPPSSSVTSDAAGVYTIANVTPGTYAVVATKTGVGSGSVDVSVMAGSTTTSDIIISTGPPNQAPAVPFNPTPADSTFLSPRTSVALSWQCTDPENDPITYDVFFGTTPVLTSANKVASNQATASYTKTGLDTGIIYYWQVIARDKRGNIKSGPVWRFKIVDVNYALRFNANDSYCTVDDASDLRLSGGDFTLEAWVYFQNDISNWYTILSKDDSDNDTDYALMADRPTRKFRFQTRNFNTVLYSLTSVVPGKWFHIAAVQRTATNKVELYVNGVLESVGDIMGSTSTNTSPLRIGARLNSVSSYKPAVVMDGIIDEVRIWNTARTLNDIQTNFNKRLRGNENGLVALWNFNEGAGDKTIDATGKKHDAVLMNKPVWTVSQAPIK